MTNEEIKAKRDEYYAAIKTAEEGLEELRKSCSHEHVSVENYSWRVGVVDLANVCSDCGKVLGIVE